MSAPYPLNIGLSILSILWIAGSIGASGRDHHYYVMGLFSPDGKWVLTGSADNTARLWRTDYYDAISDLCGILLRDFSADERTQYEIEGAQPTCPKP